MDLLWADQIAQMTPLVLIQVSEIVKKTFAYLRPDPPLTVLRIDTPPVAVKVLAPAVELVGTFDPLTFFIWLRT